MTGRQWADLASAVELDALGDEQTVWAGLTDWAIELGAIGALPTYEEIGS